MQRQPVISVAITSIGYDADTYRLEVEMHDGHVVEYAGVPYALYKSLMLADSRIAFIREHLDGHFASHEVATR